MFSKLRKMIFSKFQKSIMLIFQSSENAQNLISKDEIFVNRCQNFRISLIFSKNEIFGSRAGHLFYFIQSSYEMSQYIPRYLKLSWWTLSLSKTK